jgi:hypothetical protein
MIVYNVDCVPAFLVRDMKARGYEFDEARP